MRTLLVVALLCVVCVTPLLAQEGPPRRSIGLGLLASPNPYRGSDTNVFPIPVVVLRGERVSFVGIRLSAHLWKEGAWSFDAIAQPRFGGFDPDDSPFLKGMEERELSLDAGVELQWQSREWAVSVDALQDVLSRSEGFESSVNVQRRYQFGRWFISPGVGLAWQSEKLADYYYGVRRNEAREGRPVYEPSSALVPSLGVDIVHVFANPRWSARLLLDVELLPDKLNDSPIIEDDWSAFMAVAGSYSF